MSGRRPGEPAGDRTPYLLGAQLGLILLLLPLAVTPSLARIFEPFAAVLPLVTRLALSWIFPISGSAVVISLLLYSWLARDQLRRHLLLAWGAVLVGFCFLLLYGFGALAPMMPL